jgi:Asp-tRNA(Asn)/Glu-tRNA(Gln) amidotransferase A subunit family amidase
MWDQADEDARAAFEELAGYLGEDAEEVELPDNFKGALDWHRTILEADLARRFEVDYERGKDRMSGVLREMIERGRKILAVDYNRAVERVSVLNGLLEEVFHWCDAILTPATTGEAPLGLGSTGNPVFCTIWTLCGTPAITIPILEGANGMPIGAQLTGPRGDDVRLLRTARWLEKRLAV